MHRTEAASQCGEKRLVKKCLASFFPWKKAREPVVVASCMKKLRHLWICLASLAGALGLLIGAAFVPAVQTGVARQVLEGQFGEHASLGRLAIGWSRIRVEDFRLEQPGCVVALPSLEAEWSLSSALRKRVKLRRLLAKGWSVELSAAPAAQADEPAAQTPVVPFPGVFRLIELPVDFVLDAAELEGTVALPGERLGVSVAGGQLGVGRQGLFNLALTLHPVTGGAVESVQANGTLAVTMDTPRTVSRVSAQLDAEARGAQWPEGARLSLLATLARVAAGESYEVRLSAVGKQLIFAQAGWSAGGEPVSGSWKVDMRTADLAPFVAGRALPTFEVLGAGRFESDLEGARLRMAGRFEAMLDQLSVLRPELAALGAVRVVTDFDVRRDGETWRVERLSATADGAQPALRIEATQPFAVRMGSGALQLSDPDKALAHIVLLGVPVSWAQPWLGGLSVAGGPLRGEFVAAARDGHFSLRTTVPVTLSGLSLAQGSEAWLRAVDFSGNLSASSSAKGWQAELSGMTLRSGGAVLLSLDARAGQLAGAGQPVKVQAQASSDLPALMAQPLLADSLVLHSGVAEAGVAASLGDTIELEANVHASKLRVGVQSLPELVAQIRADVAADGRTTAEMPVRLISAEPARVSDLTLTGSLQPRAGGRGGVVDGVVLSQFMALEDVQALTAMSVSGAAAEGAPVPAKTPEPFWSGWSGRLTLALKQLTYNNELSVSDVSGTLRIEDGALKLNELTAGLGVGGDLKLNGEVTFDAGAGAPYALLAQSVVENFEVGAVFRALDPQTPPPLEGKFSVRSRWKGRGADLNGALALARTETSVNSKGGMFRLLRASSSDKVSRTQSTVEAIGGFLGSVVKSERLTDYANRAQIVNDIASALAEIPFDQLSLQLARDAQMNIRLQDFSMIAPDVRLSGEGEIRGTEGSSVSRPMELSMRMATRGRLAELFGRAKLLNGQKDNLGYAELSSPLSIKGSLRQPDAHSLVALLMESALFK